MVATGSPDPDADMLERLRQCVGSEIPIVGTLDLHANVSERSVVAADMLAAYLTNPHMDMFERGEEAAHALRAILAGSAQPKTAYVKVPLTPPTAILLTREGPYADIIDFGQRRKRELGGKILNVSISAGFVYADTDTTGMAIWVTGRHDLEPARTLMAEIAERVWADRERFKRVLTSMEEAVRGAVERGKGPNLPAYIYADIGDNPGGGGCGNTTEFLAALIEAGADGVLMGAFFEPELAAVAVETGVGAELDAVFNANPRTMFSTRYECRATVAAVSTEAFVGRLGQYTGTLIEASPSAALQIGGITVVVISNRYQTSDPMFFEHLGLDIAQARTVCVKSRGHFRAGFEPWFTPDRVLEVDTPGFTSPVLSRFDWKGLPRPVFPLDEETEWTPPLV
jgi:microcystin degradation protein MlrC